MNLAHLLQRIALQDPGRPAILCGSDTSHDYGRWARRCARLAGALRAQGLQPGDRVALFARNHPAYLEVMWGAWWAGLAVVPVNARLHVREAQWILAHSGASRVFVTADVGAELGASDGSVPCVDLDGPAYEVLFDAEPVPVCERAPTDLAWLFYTSGTTGRPKGVMIMHRNLMAMGLTYFADVDTVQAADAIVYAAPMSHGAGIYTVPHVMAGARHVVPASGGFDPAELFGLSRTVGRLCLFAAPTIVRRLVDHAEATGAASDGFKTIVYGGAPMYVADIQHALRVMGPCFVQIYGQGETPMTGTVLSRAHLADAAHPRHAARLGSVGVAQACVQVRVADEAGHPLPAGGVGEVQVRGDSVMAGYWQDAKATAAALRDGWLCTGDVGSLDEDGFLTLKDRSKDLFISGGSNVYPREIEEVLLLHPALVEVAVIGVPDPEWGEIGVAYVVAREGQSVAAADLDALCLAHIARFKRPRHYRVVEALPKNAYGKVLKTALREQWGNEPPPTS